MNLYAVLQNENVLATLDVDERTETLCMVALAKNPLALSRMSVTTPFLEQRAIGEYIIRRSAFRRPLQRLPIMYEPTQEMMMLAIEKEPTSLDDIHEDDKSMEMCLHAVSKCQGALAYVPKQFLTEELCNVAIRAPSTPHESPALRYVPIHMQTPAMCLVAVKANPYAIRYVVNQTEDLCLLAIANNFNCIIDIDPDKQTDRVCDAAIKEECSNLLYIHNQTEELCISAIQMNVRALKYAHVHTPKMRHVAQQIAAQRGVPDWRGTACHERYPPPTKKRCLRTYRENKVRFNEFLLGTHRRFVVRAIIVEKLAALLSGNLSINLLSEIAFCLDTYALFKPHIHARATFMDRARHLTQLDRWNLAVMVREAT